MLEQRRGLQQHRGGHLFVGGLLQRMAEGRSPLAVAAVVRRCCRCRRSRRPRSTGSRSPAYAAGVFTDTHARAPICQFATYRGEVVVGLCPVHLRGVGDCARTPGSAGRSRPATDPPSLPRHHRRFSPVIAFVLLREGEQVAVVMRARPPSGVANRHAVEHAFRRAQLHAAGDGGIEPGGLFAEPCTTVGPSMVRRYRWPRWRAAGDRSPAARRGRW